MYVYSPPQMVSVYWAATGFHQVFTYMVQCTGNIPVVATEVVLRSVWSFCCRRHRISLLISLADQVLVLRHMRCVCMYIYLYNVCMWLRFLRKLYTCTCVHNVRTASVVLWLWVQISPDCSSLLHKAVGFILCVLCCFVLWVHNNRCIVEKLIRYLYGKSCA